MIEWRTVNSNTSEMITLSLHTAKSMLAKHPLSTYWNLCDGARERKLLVQIHAWIDGGQEAVSARQLKWIIQSLRNSSELKEHAHHNAVPQESHACMMMTEMGTILALKGCCDWVLDHREWMHAESSTNMWASRICKAMLSVHNRWRCESIHIMIILAAISMMTVI